MELNSIPKIYTLGTRFNAAIWDGPVVIQEKVDGSQFSFKHEGGILVCRSKGQIINQSDPGMFQAAVDTAVRLFAAGKLQEGAHYQCEYLQKPKHNVLCYERAPEQFLVLFDVHVDKEVGYMFPLCVKDIAQHLGLDWAQTLYDGPVAIGPGLDEMLQELMNSKSILGGPMEGIVIKNYTLEHPERPGHPMTAKFVRPEFKEKQEGSSPANKPSGTDKIQRIVNQLRTEARWCKAIQHLREGPGLQKMEADIGPLVREIQRDVLEEEKQWIGEQLFEIFSKEIAKGVVQGFAQYYKKILNDGMTVFQEHETRSAGTCDSAPIV